MQLVFCVHGHFVFCFLFYCLLCMERAKEGIYALFKYTLRSAGWYLLGVGFSAILFVPTVMALMNGKGSELFASISFGFRDSLFGVVKGNVIGTLSDGHSTQLHLFCGSISFVLALSFYFNRRILRKKGLFIFSCLLCLYFLLFSYLLIVSGTVLDLWHRTIVGLPL